MKDIILTGIAIFCAGGALIGTALIVYFACCMQSAENAEKVKQ